MSAVAEPHLYDWEFIPPEIGHLLRLDARRQYLPIFYLDKLNFRTKDLIEVSRYSYSDIFRKCFWSLVIFERFIRYLKKKERLTSSDQIYKPFLNDLQVTPEMEKINLTIHYRPVSIGKLRLLISAFYSMEQIKQFGFGEKDVDDVKVKYENCTV